MAGFLLGHALNNGVGHRRKKSSIEGNFPFDIAHHLGKKNPRRPITEPPGMSRGVLFDVLGDELRHLEHADLFLAAEDCFEGWVRVEHDLLFGKRLEALPNPRRSGAQSSLTKDSRSAHGSLLLGE
jgi:hypothetical protein